MEQQENSQAINDDIIPVSHSLLTDFDIHLFSSGTHYHLYRKLGAHITVINGQQGVFFAVWAPNARYVSVIGGFNDWNDHSHSMQPRADGSGIWELFIPGVAAGMLYKYRIESITGYIADKSDPFSFYREMPPATASVVTTPDYKWTDKKWLKEREKTHPLSKPLSIYELHAGSWRRVPEEGSRFMTYRELAAELPGYCTYMGFTHVELMPVMEHPFYGSWGYQVTGYYAPTARFGTPQDFMHLVNALHNAGIGVILDWVPSHFPTDEHGLIYFDGTHLYEHADARQGYHPDWQSAIFNYGRNEVKAFLISNALYWLDVFHIDGLRVDAVASMLYLDYSRKAGEWVPNIHGGRENLEAIQFLQSFNKAVHEHHPDTFTIAEESTAWPGVTHPEDAGGLGFDLKWMMGWMHDTLSYFSKDPLYRTHHQGMLSFSLHYAFSEKFVLPLSHDEVVYGKASLINKMPGDDWEQFANLRLLYSYMYGHPGAKMIFMGGEFAQRHEWRHDYSLDWNENNDPLHNGIQQLLRKLNELYQTYPALYAQNFSPQGFEWIDHNDNTNSVFCWIRKAVDPADTLLFVANFTPAVHRNYRTGVPAMGFWQLLLNTDAAAYGGSAMEVITMAEAFPVPMHGRSHSLSLILPPLAVLVFKWSKTNIHGNNS